MIRIDLFTSLYAVKNTAYNEVNKSILIIYIIQQGGYYIHTNQNNPPPSYLSTPTNEAAQVNRLNG